MTAQACPVRTVENRSSVWCKRLGALTIALVAKGADWRARAIPGSEHVRRCFPRGHIEGVGIRAYTVFHGDDFAKTGISSVRIETGFELGMKNRISRIELL